MVAEFMNCPYLFIEEQIKLMEKSNQYIAFLRGINVGGRHKVPMKELSDQMAKLGYSSIVTILNSGNIIFTAPLKGEQDMEDELSAHLEKVFGFPIPVIIRNAEAIKALMSHNPFKDVVVTKDTRLYVTFLKDIPKKKVTLPYFSDDKSFSITDEQDKTVCSILDLSINSSPKVMEALEELFGKNITTRNWNTVMKIGAKLH